MAAPILLSGMVCPGFGQYYQRRWQAGTMWLAGFLVISVWFLAATVPIIRYYYSFAVAGMEPQDGNGGPMPNTNMLRLVLRMGVVLIVYFANLLDVVAAAIRERDKSGARRQRELMQEADMAVARAQEPTPPKATGPRG